MTGQTALKVDAETIATAIGKSRRKVQQDAMAKRWRYDEEVLPTGNRKRVYLVSDLPSKIRSAILDHEVDRVRTAVPAPLESVPQRSRDVADLTAWQREVMEARAAILGWIDDKAAVFGKDAIVRKLVGLSKTDQLPESLRELVAAANAKSGRQGGRARTKLSRASVYNWFKAREEHGVVGLAPEPSARPDMNIPAWAPAMLELYRRPGKRALADVLRDLPDHLPAEVEIPSYDQARRFLGKLSPITRNRGRMGPQALKSLKAFTRRDTGDLWPTAVYSSDGHTFKATVEHPFHGQPFRPEVTAVIDIFTRYVTGWSVGLAENSLGVLEALSASIVARDDGRHRGLPAIWYTDNGPGFRAELFEATATGFYDRWGITPKNSLPYNSQARGVIERLNKTLWVPAARKIASYAGRDVDKQFARDRKKITDAALKTRGRSPFDLTWDEFKAFVQAEIDAYNARQHSGLPRVRDAVTKRYRHLSPKEAWDRWEGEATLIGPEDMADLARPYEKRRVARCEVRVLGNLYFSNDLEAFHGEDVLVGYDIHDASKVWVRTFADQRLIAVAELDANRRPYFDDGVLRTALSKQEQVLQTRTKGRLALLDRKRAEVLAEAKGAPLVIEHQPAEPLTLEQEARAERELARIETPRKPIAIATEPSTRPTFGDDASLARWVLTHPNAATAADFAFVRNALRNASFRMLLDVDGVDVAGLQSLVKERGAA